MGILVYFYQTDEYGEGCMFTNDSGNILGIVDGNDGNWRHEYFNPVFAEAGVSIVDGGGFSEDDEHLYCKLKNYLG